jgi:hypothetical protein
MSEKSSPREKPTILRRAVVAAAIASSSLIAACTPGSSEISANPTVAESTVTTEAPTTILEAPSIPEITTTTASPEVVQGQLTDELIQEKLNFLDTLEAVDPLIMKDMLDDVRSNGTRQESGANRFDFRRVQQAADGTLYTIDLTFLPTEADPLPTDPSGVQVYIRKPGEKRASKVVSDGYVNESESVVMKTGGIDGKVDHTTLGETNEDFQDAIARIKRTYTTRGVTDYDAVHLAFEKYDNERLILGGTEAQALYLQALKDLYGK